MSRWRQATLGTELKRAQGDYLEHVMGLDGPVLIVFWSDDVDYGPFLRAVTKVHQERTDEILLVRADVADLAEHFNKLRTEKAYNAYNLDRLPALGLFREGRLITTFNPVLPVSAKVMEKEIEQQFRRFLQTFVDYDPEKVTHNHKK